MIMTNADGEQRKMENRNKKQDTLTILMEAYALRCTELKAVLLHSLSQNNLLHSSSMKALEPSQPAFAC